MVVIYDLEVLSNYFLYVDKAYNQKVYNVFEISKFKNDYQELLKHLQKVKGQIGFNNINYDSQIIEQLIRNRTELSKIENGEQLAKIIYGYSQAAISSAFPTFCEKDLHIKQLDPFKILHYDNKARSCSLKWAQYSMDWHNIQDMPIEHWQTIDDEDTAKSIIDYCKNDCDSTNELYEIVKGNTIHPIYSGKDKVQLRKDVEKEFGFRCINYSDVKIGDELNKIKYSKKLGIDVKKLKYIDKKPNLNFTFAECMPNYVKFQTKEFNNFVDSFKNLKINLTEKQEFRFKYNNTKYTIGKGGIHSDDDSRLIVPSKSQILIDADVGSQYPNGIAKRNLYPAHLDKVWIENYKETIQQRLDAKALYKKTKDNKHESIAETYKLALNGGGFGKTNESTNWQYDPFVCFQTTIGNQMEILMLIEMLELKNIHIVQANTDGIVCLFDRDLEKTYYDTCHEWEKLVGNDTLGKLEYKEYALLAERSINHYLAIPSDGSEPKTKGCFLIDYELHKNKSFKIIPLALKEWFHKGINPTKFIKEHNNIFDFCAGVRAKGDWRYVTHQLVKGEYKKETLQKTVRYFISNSGCKLIKTNIAQGDNRTLQEEAGKWLCTIYNKHEQKPIRDYNINYDYYIEKTYEIISEIQPEIINKNYTQLSFF